MRSFKWRCENIRYVFNYVGFSIFTLASLNIEYNNSLLHFFQTWTNYLLRKDNWYKLTMNQNLGVFTFFSLGYN